MQPTTLARWQADGRRPGLRRRLRPYRQGSARSWAGVARAYGTVAGADTQRLLDLSPKSLPAGTYAYRLFISLEYFFALLGGFDQSIP